MGLSQLVYPGAQHSRFNHVLGCMHLTGRILDALRLKGVRINDREYQSALFASLLHDIGHGPYSHALEHEWVPGLNHERLGSLIIERLNVEYNGILDEALDIYSGRHPRKFLNQILSGHLDADRLDYLKRDSYYCGVPEGSLNIERLIRIFDVVDDALVVLEKGVHSIEEFLMARRFMYWQVYLHKTSLVAEIYLKKAIRRARQLMMEGRELPASPALEFFLRTHEQHPEGPELDKVYPNFLLLDDSDVLQALKMWKESSDPLLSYFSTSVVDRKLPSIQWIGREEFDAGMDLNLERYASTSTRVRDLGIIDEELEHFFFLDAVKNSPYNTEVPEIRVLISDGRLRLFSEVSEWFGQMRPGQIDQRYFRVCPKEDSGGTGAVK